MRLRLIYTPHPGAPMTPITPEKTRYQVGYELSHGFLSGRGMEMGPGKSPQKLPPGATALCFDKRNAQELAKLFAAHAGSFNYELHSLDVAHDKFPQGADFLISHHVLEHASNPIKELVRWHSFLKPGARVLHSLPDPDKRADGLRNVPPLEHLLLDYALDRGDDDFESREHVYSYCLAWFEDGSRKGLSKLDAAKKSLDSAKSKQADLHWHALTAELAVAVIHLAAHVANRKVVFKTITFEGQTAQVLRHGGNLFFMYELGDAPAAELPGPIAKAWAKLDQRLEAARTRLDKNRPQITLTPEPPPPADTRELKQLRAKNAELERKLSAANAQLRAISKSRGWRLLTTVNEVLRRGRRGFSRRQRKVDGK